MLQSERVLLCAFSLSAVFRLVALSLVSLSLPAWLLSLSSRCRCPRGCSLSRLPVVARVVALCLSVRCPQFSLSLVFVPSALFGTFVQFSSALVLIMFVHF